MSADVERMEALQWKLKNYGLTPSEKRELKQLKKAAKCKCLKMGGSKPVVIRKGGS